MSPAIVHRVAVHRLAIPFRDRMRQRRFAEPLIVEVEMTGGTVGIGETSTRHGTCDETPESIAEDISQVLGTALLGFRAESFPEALEAIDSLPWENAQGRSIPAARAGVEFALLDAAMQFFKRSAEDVVQWMGLSGFGGPGSSRTARYSGCPWSSDPAATIKQIRKMYWLGLRDFKLTVGGVEDVEPVRAAIDYLSRSIARGRSTVRVDAQGGWSTERAAQWLAETSDLPIAAVEQPLPRGQESKLAELRERFSVPLVHDESLVTEEDARQLIALGVADLFGIQMIKCGGLLPSLRIADVARKHNVGIELGKGIGDTSVLTAIGTRFLSVCPGIRWVEGRLGREKPQGDIVRDGLRFRTSGLPPRLEGSGWGIVLDMERLDTLRIDDPMVIHF